jgi:hypothetical protein
MKVAIFTPTAHFGNLDVLEASLTRQTYKNFVWIVADELKGKRKYIWYKIISRVDFPILFIQPTKEKNKKRNLAKAYNVAADYASLVENSDLFISLQDFIWLPENGIERFIALYEWKPTDLYTGVTHISNDPFPKNVKDINGLYTIFDSPFVEKPKRIGWEDVRVKKIYSGYPEDSVVKIDPHHWEANWAGVPVSLLKKGLRWNEDYDYGIAYENCDFAQRATREYGANVLLDTGNIAISLPHKKYFKGEEEEIIEFSNRERYEKDWNL